MAGRPAALTYDPPVNLARLRVFEEVARTGTFAAAADALSYTPSAVSQQMSKLEGELGVVLVARTPRGVKLTDAGRTLLARTATILAEVRAAQAELDALAGLRGGTLRFGSFPTATQTLGGRALGVFRARFPEVRVILVDDEPHGNVARLHARELDLALIFAVDGRAVTVDYFGQPVCPEDAVTLRPLLEDRFVLIVPEGHRLAAEPATLEALAGETMIGSSRTPGLDLLAAECREHGIELDFNGFVCTDYGAVRALVAGGEGIAAIPALAAARPFEGTVTRRLEGWAPRRSILVASPADGLLSPAATAMCGVLSELAAVVQAPELLAA